MSYQKTSHRQRVEGSDLIPKPATVPDGGDDHANHSMHRSSRAMRFTGETKVAGDQYPKLAGKPPPFDHLEPKWFDSDDFLGKRSERFYEKGARKDITREVPLYGGGTGRVVNSTKESDLAGKGES